MNSSQPVAIVGHVAFEGPARIADELDALGFRRLSVRLYAGDRLPAADRIAGLVSMGGPMSVNDTEPTWIAAEQALIRSVAVAGKPVLGVCLGAQQIAQAFGATVAAGPEPEIGYWPVDLDPRFAAELGVPQRIRSFHWHGEMVSWDRDAIAALPPDLRLRDRLAATPGCSNQLFLLGPRVAALQFHPEVGPAEVRTIYDCCAEEYHRLAERRFVCAVDTIPDPRVEIALLRAIVTRVFGDGVAPG